MIHENAPVDETRDKMLGAWSPDPVWKKFIDTTLAAHGKKVEILQGFVGILANNCARAHSEALLPFQREIERDLQR